LFPSSFSPRANLLKHFGIANQGKFGYLSKWFSKSPCLNPTQNKNREIIVRNFRECIPDQL
jgi:hypothetical protein